MKKLLSLFLALTLVLTLGAPALAVGKTAEADQPTWQQMGYQSLEELLKESDYTETDYYRWNATPAEAEAWVEAYVATHPEEAAAFDAETYFAGVCGDTVTKADYMEAFGMADEDAFRKEMRHKWVVEQYQRAEDQAVITAYTAAHPDEVAVFDAEAYFAANYMDYFETKEELMDSWGIQTSEDFRDQILLRYIEAQNAVAEAKTLWVATVAAEPEFTAQFLAEVEHWTQDYWYATSLGEYMENHGHTAVEQAYNELYYSWKSDYEYAQQAKAERDAYLAGLGGTPGQLNVMVNDKCISFGPAKPKLGADGALLAPAQDLAKALGIMVKGDAEGYAPVRATAENAGWDVLWDDEYQTAALLNRTGIISEIDAKFTQLDTLYVKLLDLVKREEGQSYQINETLSFNLAAFDSLDGDKTYTAGVKGTSTVKDGAVSASLTLDVAGLVRQLSPELRSAITASLPKKISPATLLELLGGIKVDVILSPEDGLYIHAPILAQFVEGVDADSWLYFESPSFYYGDEEAADTTEAAPASLNIGSMLYAGHIDGYYNQIGTYSDMMDSVDELAAFLGNDRFAVSGDDISYKLDTKTVNAAVAKATEDSYTGAMTNLFRTADVGVTLSGGKLSFKAEVRPNTEGMAIEYGDGGPGTVLTAWLASLVDFRFKSSGTATATGSNMTMELHWKNQFKATVNYTSTTQKTNTAPAIALPAAEDVVDANDFMYGFYPMYSMR